MAQVLFVIFVSIVGFALLASGAGAFLAGARTGGGWLAGVFIAIVLFVVSQSYFQPLPLKVVSDTEQGGVDWDAIFNEVARFRLLYTVIGFVVCLIVLGILQRWMDMSEKLYAFILLVFSFASLSALLYVFLIRKSADLIFSAVMGIVIGVPIYIAFFADLQKWKKFSG